MIKSMGIELEGSWPRGKLPEIFFVHKGDLTEYGHNTTQLFEDFEKKYNCEIPDGHKIFRSDGSVYFSINELNEKFGVGSQPLIGEIASPIFNNVKDMCKFIEDFMPHGNDSTGCHIHFKPTMGDYQNAVMNYGKFKDDYLKFIEYLGYDKGIPANHRYFTRIKGDVHWCLKSLTIRDVRNQLTNDEYHSRYRHVNFCWTKKGTIELRSFPIFQSKTLQKTIARDVIKYLNTWFLLHPCKQKEMVVTV